MKEDYFKGYKIFKIVQLIILIVFAVVFFGYIFLDDELRPHLFTNKNLLTIAVFLWGFMIYSVVCIILDFHQLEGHIMHDEVLNCAVYRDALTGIPNRFGCDRIFEKYGNEKDISDLGCSLIEISNLDEINRMSGRSAGNVALKDFSRMIERVGAYFGFVGRNSGNEFLTVIEKCDESKMNRFIDELRKEIDEYNKSNEGMKIAINSTNVINSSLGIDDFNGLIAKLYADARGK